MPRGAYSIISSYGIDRDVVINGQQCVNMYMVPSNVNKEGAVLVPASGHENPIAFGINDAFRTQFVFDGNMYSVVSDILYKTDTARVSVVCGTLSTTVGYVGIDANTHQVVVADGINIYVYDTSTAVFTTVPIAGVFPGDICSLDGYIITINSGSNDWYISALNNATTWNPVDTAQFSSKAGDKLVGCNVLKRRLYLQGHISTEVWEDAGAADFPFRRDNNFLFEHGIAAPKTVQHGFEMMLYLATNQDGPAGVMLIEGVSNPKKVSDQYVDLFFQNVESLQDSEATLKRENGFIFYQLSFSTDDSTFVYIVNTGKWHTLETIEGHRHIETSHAYFNNKHYIGAFNSPTLYELSYKFITYNGDLIKPLVQFAPFFDRENGGSHRRIMVDRFELECIPGMPDAIYPNPGKYPQMQALINFNDAPKVFLSVSRDGGRTFGNRQEATLGELGDYKARTIFRQIGCLESRRFVFRIEYYYTVQFYIIGASISYEVLPE